MKELCTCTTLRSTIFSRKGALIGVLAVGTGLVFASAMAETKSQPGSSSSKNPQVNAARSSRGNTNTTANQKAFVDGNGNPVAKTGRPARPIVKSQGGAAGANPACGPAAGHDCFTSGGPGCTDEACCNLVCDLDSFCCATAWDGICVSEAIANCGGGGAPANDNCADRLPIFDGDTPFSTLGATTDGPETACNGFGDPQINQDIWFNYTASVTDVITVSLCGSGYDTKVAVYTGCTCPVGAETACNDDAAVGGCVGTLQSVVTFDATAGQCYKIRVGGYLGAQGTGNVNITAGAPPSLCGDPNNHPCDQTGGPGCSDKDCCNTVCALDAFCCATAWDGICVSEAATFCGAACDATCPAGSVQEGEPCGADTNGGCNAPAGGASGDCCFAHATPGCQDPTCQNSVCAADPFCCDTQWDGICAGEALNDANCSCSASSAYGQISCGQTVCGTQWADANFRDTDWYQFTIDTDGTSVTWSVFAQFPSVAFILNNDCGNIVLIAQGTGTCPVVAEATGCSSLAAGTYVAFVAPAAFAGAPCGSGVNDYYATLNCQAPCAADVSPSGGDGVVNVDDLLFIINHWGACP